MIQLTLPLKAIQPLALLFLRLILAYGFYQPALLKIKNIAGIVAWFQQMGIPFPTINAYLATITESLGVVLLTLGFFTRYISIPLIITMLVAIFTVHLSHGFSASNNGFEIPLYYLLMLFTLVCFGAGKYSLDNYIFKK